MKDYMDFTISDKYSPAELAQLTNRTDPSGVHWVPLIDIGVAVGTEAAK